MGSYFLGGVHFGHFGGTFPKYFPQNWKMSGILFDEQRTYSKAVFGLDSISNQFKKLGLNSNELQRLHLKISKFGAKVCHIVNLCHFAGN